MIEPSGTRITLPPNTQSKVPGLGANQPKGQKQDSYCVPQAQDDKGYGGLSNAGISDNVPGKTMHATKQAQDAGSVQAGISVGAALNVGAPGWNGQKQIPLSEVTGFNTAGGRNQTKLKESVANPSSNKDIGVQTESMLTGFPSGLHE